LNKTLQKTTSYLRLIRPHQYIKNAFVWLGVIFSQTKIWDDFIHVGFVFLAFCAAASCVYIFNDIFDVEADRLHPIKCHRPIASGAVTILTAWFLSILLAILAVSMAALVGWISVTLIGMYLLINIAYSLRLKHVVILDVFIISAGFMLRILIGTVGIGITPSQWLLLTGLMLTLFLGFAKRRAELLMLENEGKTDRASVRRVLHDYSPVVLDQLTGITAACTILSYGLYMVSAETINLHGTFALFYTLPFVIYGMFRYLYLLHHHSRGSDTAKDLIADPHLIVTGFGWLFVTLAVLA
jgi:4-hydroxybenzoate polyprenyltransferase